MAIYANIVAFDGASTPVSHTFSPDGAVQKSNGSLILPYRETGSPNPIGAQPRVFIRKSVTGAGVQVFELETWFPFMEIASGGTIDGYSAPPKVAYNERMVTIGYVHPRSTTTNRRLVRQLHSNVLSGIVNSITPVVTGAWPETYDLGTVPA